MKIRSVGAKLFHAGRHQELQYSLFVIFAKAPQTLNSVWTHITEDFPQFLTFLRSINTRQKARHNCYPACMLHFLACYFGPVLDLDKPLINLLNLLVTWCTNSLTFNNCTLCPHCIMCFVFIWEQTATCATYSINWLVFITEMKSCHLMQQQFNTQQLYALPTPYLCVLYLSENKLRLVPLTA